MSALEHAAGALLVLQAAMVRRDEGFTGFMRIRAVECLRVLQADGIDAAWLHVGIADIGDLGASAWEIEHVVADCLVGVEEIMVSEALAEMLAALAAPAATESRPASPPPPSGRGDEEAQEEAAARAATGETLPPESGDVPLGWMACAGPDTEPPLADADLWDPERTLVPV